MDTKTILTHFTLGKQERLKSRKLIAQLFNAGKAITAPPVKALYMIRKEGEPLQAGFTVGSKAFKRAVDRNRIKRLMREAFRLNKGILQDKIIESGKSVSLFLIYTNKDLPNLDVVTQKIVTILNAVSKDLSAE